LKVIEENLDAESGSPGRALTTKGVARLLGTTFGRVYGLICRNVVPVQKVAGRYRWDEAAVNAVRQALRVELEGEEPVGLTTEEARHQLGVDYGTLMSLLHPLRRRTAIPHHRGRVIMTPEIMEEVKSVLRKRVESDERRIASRRRELDGRMEEILHEWERIATELFGPESPRAKAALGALGERFKELLSAASELAEPAALVCYIATVPDRRYEVVFPIPVFVYSLHARYRAVLAEGGTELEAVGELPHKAVRLLRNLLWRRFREKPTDELGLLIVEAGRRATEEG
jgi:hypothetical protein